MMSLKRISLLLAGLLAAAAPLISQPVRDNLDKALDEYELLLGQASSIKERIASGEDIPEYEMYGLSMRLSSIRATLSRGGDSMTPSQKARFGSLIRQYVAAEHGFTLKTTGYVPERSATIHTVARLSETVETESLPRLSFCRPFPKTKWRIFSVACVSGFDGAVPGLRLGLMKGAFGAYLSGRTSFKRTESSYSCLSDGTIDGGATIYTTGHKAVFHAGATAGILALPIRFGGFDDGRLGIYAGAGWGTRELFWEDINGNWALVSDRSPSGVAAEAGVMFVWKHLILSAGTSTVKFRHADFEAGLGIRF